jgi:hypothetical protein
VDEELAFLLNVLKVAGPFLGMDAYYVEAGCLILLHPVYLQFSQNNPRPLPPSLTPSL